MADRDATSLHQLILGVACTLFTTTSCASHRGPSAQELAVAVAGCYELEPGPWLMDSIVIDGLWTSQAPRTFQLTASRLPELAGQPRFGAGSLDSAGRSEGWLRQWWQDPSVPNGIVVDRPLSPGGYTFRLRRVGERLVGELRVWTDAASKGMPTEAKREVTARRIPCPASAHWRMPLREE